MARDWCNDGRRTFFHQKIIGRSEADEVRRRINLLVPRPLSLLDIIKVLMEGLFEVVEGVKGNHEAYQPDDGSGLDDPEKPLQVLKGKGDGNNHAPDEIRDSRRNSSPQVSAELFRCDSDEYGPVADRKSYRHAMHIKKRRAHPAEHEINGDCHPGKDLEHKDDLFSASKELAQKPARKIAE